MSKPTTLKMARGALCLIGTHIDEIASKALKSIEGLVQVSPLPEASFHITLFSKAELQKIAPDKLVNLSLGTQHVYFAGVGGHTKSGTVFAVIIWAAGQQVRKAFGLLPKHFHITLSQQDVHDINKGIDALLPNQFPTSPSPEFLDHLAYTLHIFGQHQRALEYCRDLILALPQSYKGFLRMADAAFWGGKFKLAMLSYACTYDRSSDQKVQAYCTKKMIECSKETEWGPIMLEDEILEIPEDVSVALLTPWSLRLRLALSDANITPALTLQPRQSLLIPAVDSAARPFYKLPRFFRWLIPHYFAIMSTPRNEDDINALASPHLGIRHVLTLTEEEPLHESWFLGKSISNTYLPIRNFYPPSIEQMDLIMTLFNDESKLPLLVHCGGGKGRAGTVAACYIAAFGFQKTHYSQTQPEVSAQEAVSLIRQLRPGSIETSQQEAFVSKWCSAIWKRQSIYPDLPTEPPPCPLVIEGSLTRDTNLYVLVGLPGSGKSWFSKSLLARDPSNWTIISQDEAGSRTVCESQISRTPHGCILLDRCNAAASDRKGWLDLASNWVKSPTCIWFDYDRDLCTSRAQMRFGHPTLPPGGRVRSAIDQMEKVFVRPALKEGFAAVVIVRSFGAAVELVHRLSSIIGIYKFPRTPHLLNLGAATSDDIVIGDYTASVQGNVVITEKIDGANMGFSLSADRSRIVVQNRSHYVDPSTHEQFKKLGIWVERHSEDLFKVLDRDRYFAERYILFGEWVFATHSIPYTRLPGRFLAFDLYDRATKTWSDRKTLSSLLSTTAIPLVPILYEGAMPSETELKNMVQLQSNFWDGRVEGIYLKVEKDSHVVSRGKVVRSDFIAGNEHWSRGNLQVNGLDVID